MQNAVIIAKDAEFISLDMEKALFCFSVLEIKALKLKTLNSPKIIGLISKGETMLNIKAGKPHKEGLLEWLKKKPEHQQEYRTLGVAEVLD
ncbi:MAG: hypothetical protein KGQ59_07600 [Bdellovibrionales bacterium]|nr:hypothetical protein [Bdellovibrionales bacterium]